MDVQGFFRVDGADLESGEETYLILQAANLNDAEYIARKQGLLISSVRLASSADWGVPPTQPPTFSENAPLIEFESGGPRDVIVNQDAMAPAYLAQEPLPAIAPQPELSFAQDLPHDMPLEISSEVTSPSIQPASITSETSAEPLSLISQQPIEIAPEEAPPASQPEDLMPISDTSPHSPAQVIAEERKPETESGEMHHRPEIANAAEMAIPTPDFVKSATEEFTVENVADAASNTSPDAVGLADADSNALNRGKATSETESSHLLPVTIQPYIEVPKQGDFPVQQSECDLSAPGALIPLLDSAAMPEEEQVFADVSLSSEKTPWNGPELGSNISSGTLPQEEPGELRLVPPDDAVVVETPPRVLNSAIPPEKVPIPVIPEAPHASIDEISSVALPENISDVRQVLAEPPAVIQPNGRAVGPPRRSDGFPNVTKPPIAQKQGAPAGVKTIVKPGVSKAPVAVALDSGGADSKPVVKPAKSKAPASVPPSGETPTPKPARKGVTPPRPVPPGTIPRRPTRLTPAEVRRVPPIVISSAAVEAPPFPVSKSRALEIADSATSEPSPAMGKTSATAPRTREYAEGDTTFPPPSLEENDLEAIGSPWLSGETSGGPGIEQVVTKMAWDKAAVAVDHSAGSALEALTSSQSATDHPDRAVILSAEPATENVRPAPAESALMPLNEETANAAAVLSAASPLAQQSLSDSTKYAAGPGRSPMFYVLGPLAFLFTVAGMGLMIYALLAVAPRELSDFERIDFRVLALGKAFLGGMVFLAGLILFLAAGLTHVAAQVKFRRS